MSDLRSPGPLPFLEDELLQRLGESEVARDQAELEWDKAEHEWEYQYALALVRAADQWPDANQTFVRSKVVIESGTEGHPLSVARINRAAAKATKLQSSATFWQLKHRWNALQNAGWKKP